MTRAEAAQMFYNLLLDKNVQTVGSFPDVSDGAWYATAVKTLAALNIIVGFPDGGFHPDDPITRAQFAAIVVRFDGIVMSGDATFTDVPPDYWAYDDISTAANFGWVVGVGDGLFAPDLDITRAEAVTLVNRVIKRRPDEAYIDSHPEMDLFTDVPPGYWAYYDIIDASSWFEIQ